MVAAVGQVYSLALYHNGFGLNRNCI